jgi:ABC-type uncharacterized transport system permease subunit
MNPTFIALLAIIAYFSNSLIIISDILKQRITRTPLYLAWLAVSSHIIYIGLLCAQHQGFKYSFFNTSSLIALIVSLLLLVAALNKPVEKLGIALFPISAVMLLLALLFSNDTVSTPQHYDWAMNLHILSSIIAFSLLNIAALQAILLAIQNQQLKSHPPKRFIQTLPPLQTMETLLFQMIAAGVGFLSIALLSGFVFIEDLFAQHLVHKTVLSIIAWLVFVALLIGRHRYGWRGKTAMKWTLAGFSLLLLAYFGSKLVLELILHR